MRSIEGIGLREKIGCNKEDSDIYDNYVMLFY